MRASVGGIAILVARRDSRDVVKITGLGSKLSNVKHRGTLVAELDTGIPSFRWVQNAIRDRQTVAIKLVTGEEIGGRVRWQDTECICLLDDGDADILLWRNAIAWLRAR